MDKQKIYGLIRQVLAGVGGFLIALGWSDQNTITLVSNNIDIIIGAASFLISVGASLYAKVRGNIDNPTPVQAAAKAPDLVDKAVDKAIDKADKL